MREADRVYRPKNQSGLSAADRWLYKRIEKTVEKSVVPWKEKTYGRKG